MSWRRISGSIFWGLVFVALGIWMLARNFGYPVPLWTTMVRYWPILLIAWGLFKLADFFGMESGAPNRSLFSGGDIAAIVVVILFGSFLTFAANFSPDIGRIFQIGDLDVWDLTGNNFTFTEQHQLVASPDSTIEIANRYGDVEVMPGDTDRIDVDVRKTIRARDQAEAVQLSASLVYSITNEGSKYRVGTNFDRRLKASLVVHVPRRSHVTIENRNGNVSVHSLAGNQAIVNRFGGIEVHGIEGTVNIENRNGDVRVGDVRDSVTIANAFAPVSVTNVGGDLKVSGRNSRLDIEHVAGNLDLESAYQNIDILDPRGSVHVKNRNGEISIRLLQPPKQEVSVSSQYGGVSLEIPGGSVFQADVRNRYGEISSDFAELHATSERTDRTLDGQVGSGGPVIRIDGRYGEVRLRKRG